MIAGGKLTLTGGQVFGGNAVYSTTASVSANTTLQQGTVRKESVYDFAAAFTALRAKADQ